MTNNLDSIKTIGDMWYIKKTNIIIKIIDNDLNTYLSEIHINEKLIKLIDYNPNTRKNIIKDIRNCLHENTKIIQKNPPNKND